MANDVDAVNQYAATMYAATANGVMQDGFLRLQRGLPALRAEERFTSWLFQIARSSVAEHMRTRARHPLPAAPVEDEPPAEPAEDDDREAARTLAACVSILVARLPSPYREAVTLVELQGSRRARPRRWSGSRYPA